MGLRTLGTSLLLAALAGLPARAEACVDAGAMTSILHRTVPPLPDGVVAAEVEMISDARSSGPPWEARIIAMIHGDYSGTRLSIEPSFTSSCDGVPHRGARGIVVGRVLSRSRRALVIDPIREPSRNERRQRSVRPRT